jgi:hypothetical protein
MNFKAYIVAAAAALLAPAAVSAATVNISFTAFGATKSSADITGAIAARDAFIGSAPIIVQENFDGFTACDGTNGASCSFEPLDTAVGRFTGIGPTISNGGSQVAPKDKVVIRSDSPNAFNRFDVTGTDGTWLDSNDMNGIAWEIPGDSGLANITKIAFFLTDVDDVGNVRFNISADGHDNLFHMVTWPAGKQPDGTLFLVKMLFSDAVDNLAIKMKSGTNDGFGVDGVMVAAVPLPAAGFLLVGALGGLAALRRRRKAA